MHLDGEFRARLTIFESRFTLSLSLDTIAVDTAPALGVFDL